MQATIKDSGGTYSLLYLVETFVAMKHNWIYDRNSIAHGGGGGDIDDARTDVEVRVK